MYAVRDVQPARPRDDFHEAALREGPPQASVFRCWLGRDRSATARPQPMSDRPRACSRCNPSLRTRSLVAPSSALGSRHPWNTASVPRRPPLVRRTPGISCEAVPASIRAGAGIRRHLRASNAGRAHIGAAESFVSFIPLFGGTPLLRCRAGNSFTAPLPRQAIRRASPSPGPGRTRPALLNHAPTRTNTVPARNFKEAAIDARRPFFGP
jgi:hypothetical protein